MRRVCSLSFPACRVDASFAAGLVAARALVVSAARRQGNGTGKWFRVMADFNLFPSPGKPAMEFTDRILKCIDCGAEFVFTAGEQLFFHDKQFKNDPKHCKQCKARRASGNARVRAETRTTCSECGEATTVPFKPTQGRPVLCRSCFQKQQGTLRPAVKPSPAPAASPEPSPELS